MKKLTAARAAEYSGGRLISGPGDNTAVSVQRDSRKAGTGSLFTGLVGEKNDGNSFAEAAYQNGCRMFLLSCEKTAVNLGKLHPDAAVILAEDTLEAMQKLAKNYLAGCNIIRIAVTGSTGKTSTKEMLKCVFSSKYRTISNFENYNNHIGVPLTAFEVEEDTQAGIFEMGMNHSGEIRLLADIVRPETAAVTNVGISHIGNLGSRENIMHAKLEITEFMDADCTLVYNSDNDLLSGLNSKETVYNKIMAGETADASGIRISDISDLGEDGVDFLLTASGESQKFHVPLPGVHNAWNASIAVGCALRYGITLQSCAKALRNLQITGNRLNITEAGGIKIINDTYNASPDSVKAALDVLAATKCRRSVALLADMFELGEDSAEFHREVGRYAGEKNTGLVITVGENAKNIAAGAAEYIDKDRILSFNSKDEFTAVCHDILRAGDAVLVKGSHGMHMDQAAEYLAKAGTWND